MYKRQAITIDLSPAHTPNTCLEPEPATQQRKSSNNEEADRKHRGASSPAFAEVATAGGPSFAQGATCAHLGLIHFDSVDSALEAAVLRHVSQLAAGAVIVDRPGGVVRSERELRILAPNTGDARADEAAAVAIEFGVLRGLLDLVAPDARTNMRWNGAGKSLLRGDEGSPGAGAIQGVALKKKWWPFAIVLLAGALGILRGSGAASAGGVAKLGMVRGGEIGAGVMEGHRLPFRNAQGKKPVILSAAGFLAAEPQGQFATGQGFKITDGTNFFVVDPCKAQTKLYASISQTGNTQLVAGTATKRIYVCSIHVVAAAATDVAVVEGTGTVCGTGSAGASGFGGPTAATGWNFAGNGGIALGSGESSLGAESASGDNLCVFSSGSGQVSGGISYVVE